MTIYRVLRFSTDSCTICKAQKRALVIERFRDSLPPSTRLLEQVCAADEDEMKDKDKARAYELSDEYEVNAFPTLIVEAKLDGGEAVELCRFEGGVTLKQLEKGFAEAQEELISSRVAWS